MNYESKRVYTRRREDGIYGLYTNIYFSAGDEILYIRGGDKQLERDFRSIELDDGHYMHPDGMFTNHSCDPSAFVSKWSGCLIAARKIETGDEITFDYRTTETEIEGGFICSCGAKNCGGKIGWRE